MKYSPRQIAVEILTRVDREGAFAEPLLDAALSETRFGNPHDGGLLTEIVYGTLRTRGRLDWIIERLYRGYRRELETEVLNILRTGLYQLWFTDRIPTFAAVNEAVEIARRLTPGAAGLVNAVLRNALRKKEAIAWPDPTKEPEKAIAVLHSHPRWLVKRLIAQFGVEEATAICQANNAVPPLALRVNTLRASQEQTIAMLATDGIAAEPASFSADGIIIGSAPGMALRETAPFHRGLIRIQDEASQLIAHLVAPQPGERLLDLCAGVGGKTLHLAALMENRGTITALDVNSERLRMLRREAEHLGATIVETLAQDAAVLPAEFCGAFDRVLLDAPCSGLGTLRRNPEIRWRISPSDIKMCMRIQKRLIHNAAECVKPGGRLVYSVCTVIPEENEAVVEDLLKDRPDFAVFKPTAVQKIPPTLIDAAGFLRTLPHRHGTDGFFAAVLSRIAGSGDSHMSDDH